MFVFKTLMLHFINKLKLIVEHNEHFVKCNNKLCFNMLVYQPSIKIYQDAVYMNNMYKRQWVFSLEGILPSLLCNTTWIEIGKEL